MSTINKKQLRERARQKVKSLEFSIKQTAFADSRAELEEYLEVARIALASLEAEPVAWRVVFKLDGQPGSDFEKTFENQAKMNEIISLHERAGFFASITPLYTAPPAPVSVPEPIKRNDADGWWMYKGRRVGGGCAEWYNLALDDCRAAMLQGSEPVTTNNKLRDAVDAIRNSGIAIDAEKIFAERDALNSPALPDGLRLALSNAGIAAPESDEMLAATCEKYIQALVTWVKDRKPFSSTVNPDGWVACSEHMPEVGVKVLCFPVNDETIHATYNGQVWLQDISWSTSDEPIDNVISCNVFHWMPLPAAPQQEVKNG
ncbi:DUF551 domain-containing protein [Enterobacter ludwigii]|uniref:DUF551 domain-containing protein n=1 Tax=Enterobacter ludwigii TaxID=299767 RepID=UPI0022E51290|nr:DUF551 domain-containing protein [Enterobacter ludwigii]